MTSFKKLRQMLSVQGNGVIITKEIPVSSFLQLHLSVNQAVEIHHSNEERVVIEVDENLQDFVDVSNSGRTLYVSTDTGILKKAVFTSCRVKVYFRQLNVLSIANEGTDFDCKEMLEIPNEVEINIQSVGNTNLRINAPAIKLVSKCVGDVSLEGKCGLLDIKSHSVGKLQAREMIAEDVVIRNKSVGDIDLFANKTIDISHSGVGNIFYYGAAVLKDIKKNWSGLVQHKEG